MVRTCSPKRVQSMGYSQVKHSTSANGQQLAVRQDIAANFVSEWKSEGGDILSIVTPNFLLSCIWRRPGSEADDFVQELTLVSQSFPQIPWIAMGDWNWTPTENEAAPLGFLCPVLRNNHLVPTRWNAKRAVDYTLVTPPTTIHSPHLLETVGSTPKCLRRATKFSKPTDLSQQQWDDKLHASFRNFSASKISTTEVEWTMFCQAITDCLARTVPEQTQSNRPLGSLPTVVDANFAKPAFVIFRRGN